MAINRIASKRSASLSIPILKTLGLSYAASELSNFSDPSQLTASETEALHQQALSDKDALLGVQYNNAELIALTEEPTLEARYPEVQPSAICIPLPPYNLTSKCSKPLGGM